MPKELELWNFIADRLRRGENVMLLVVGDSSGSSPGRAGYKMAVADDGELTGSIGGGVMEVKLVEEAKRLLNRAHAAVTTLVDQEHRKNAKHPSGMVCSGRQTVIFKPLTPNDLDTVERIANEFAEGGYLLLLSNTDFGAGPDRCGMRRLTGAPTITFERDGDEFTYSEELNVANSLYIIGGGHCALALSELMSKLGFRIAIFDDRPSLNTLDKNEFAAEITIVGSYEEIAGHIPNEPDVYIVVMTLGYAFDAMVVRQLIDHDVNYLGVLGSKAKMATLIKELKAEGFAEDRLARIYAPIGIPINSRTPEEIAISIAAEIIAVKNADG